MQYYARYRGASLRSQAIPISTYRRQVLLAQWGPRLALLLFIGVAYPLLVVPLVGAQGIALPIPTGMFGFRSFVGGDEPWEFGALARPELAEVILPEEITSEPYVYDPRLLASAAVSLKGAGVPTSTNVKIAISFIDGYTVEPGERFSFDDIARTWDFREDMRYVLGPATSARGPILMRGGGVCWLSTAIWRAAMAAGLAIDRRENHLLYVPSLGAGLDATNTLVFRNDTEVPITVRAWLNGDTVTASLIADGETFRTASIRPPQRTASGAFVTYQDITWADGSTQSRAFTSRYGG